ncbi:hypothetical protein [Streptomyces sp. NPDC050548]|uniref:hypothetical protein n=1 Tax=Streptomyces sp. NPDC050548 TaxID=3365629 RepID=UPI00378EEB65
MNAAAAARRLGVSEPAVRKMMSAGRLHNRARTGPALVASADVDRVMTERRTEALGRHPDTMAFARQVRAQLWPEEALTREVVLADGRTERWATGGYYPAAGQVAPASGREALRTLTPDAAAVFGRAAVEVAATDPKAFAGSCRFCFADTSARVHGGLRPTDAPPYRVLLGEPCAADVQCWRAEGESRRQEVTRLRITEERARRSAEQDRTRREFRAAQDAARTAAQRLQSATQAMSTPRYAVRRQLRPGAGPPSATRRFRAGSASARCPRAATATPTTSAPRTRRATVRRP